MQTLRSSLSLQSDTLRRAFTRIGATCRDLSSADQGHDQESFGIKSGVGGLEWLQQFTNYEQKGVPKNAGVDCDEGFPLVRLFGPLIWLFSLNSSVLNAGCR
jgi:hypothetical protein